MSKNTGFIDYLKSAIPMTIWAVGISSLLVNISTSVVFAGSALYLKTVLGIGISTIGFLEAIVEAISYSIRMFSGILSDYLKKRKSIILVGFLLIAVSKPLLALSRTIGHVFISRTLDRIGNGIQASPREALVSDLAPHEHKGACYGMRQSLSVIGSSLGAIFGIIVMKSSNNNFEMMFFLAAIPATLAMFVLIFFVKDKKEAILKKAKRKHPIKLEDFARLGRKFWSFIAIMAVFMLARFSEIFISLHACDNFALNVAYGTAITLVFNLVSTLIAYPSGKLSDRIDRVSILMIGFILLLLAHTTLYLAPNLQCVFVGTVIWGGQLGISQSIAATLISDYVPKDLRGTGFGIYYFVVAISTATASACAGIISERTGTEANAFLFGAAMCSIAILLLSFFRRKYNRQTIAH